MRSKYLVLLAAAIALVSISACGGGGGGADENSMTISGKLYAGTVDPVAPSKGVAVKATPTTPLEGYDVNCIPFNDLTKGVSTTSDSSGYFDDLIWSASASFACYIVDPEAYETVASVIFTNDDNTQSGQTVRASGSVDLGTVTVSLRNGVAQATTPSGVTFVSSETVGAACPEGTWITTDVGRSDPCSEDIAATVWIVKNAGVYEASFTAYNVGIDGVCSVGSKGGLEVTLTDGVAYFDFLYEFEDPPSPTKIAHMAVTPNADCTEAAVHQRVTGCASCPCTGEGDVMCESDFTVTRQ